MELLINGMFYYFQDLTDHKENFDDGSTEQMESQISTEQSRYKEISKSLNEYTILKFKLLIFFFLKNRKIDIFFSKKTSEKLKSPRRFQRAKSWPLIFKFSTIAQIGLDRKK